MTATDWAQATFIATVITSTLQLTAVCLLARQTVFLRKADQRAQTQPVKAVVPAADITATQPITAVCPGARRPPLAYDPAQTVVMNTHDLNNVR